MARPNSTFPSERAGQPCGASWSDPLRVTGKIPNIAFGAQFEVTLDPVASSDDMRANVGMLSWRGVHEQRIRKQLDDLIDQVREDLAKFRWRIGQDNYQAIRNLLSLANAELTYVDITHEAWVERRWSLDKATYATACDTLGPGEVFGGGFDRCPTMEELDRRIDAREFIVEKFVDACHFIRCAQFGLWRVWLYRSAVEEWKTSPQGAGPDGLAPTPPEPDTPPFGSGTFSANPPPPPPPPVEPPLPPPFPSDLADGLRLPDPGEPDPPDEDDIPVVPLPPLEPPIPPGPLGEPGSQEPPTGDGSADGEGEAPPPGGLVPSGEPSSARGGLGMAAVVGLSVGAAAGITWWISRSRFDPHNKRKGKRSRS